MGHLMTNDTDVLSATITRKEEKKADCAVLYDRVKTSTLKKFNPLKRLGRCLNILARVSLKKNMVVLIFSFEFMLSVNYVQILILSSEDILTYHDKVHTTSSDETDFFSFFSL